MAVRSPLPSAWALIVLTVTSPPIGRARASLAAQIPSDRPTSTRPSGIATGRSFSYGLVVAHDQARDDLLAPLRWTGPGVGFRLEFESTGGLSIHRLSFQPLVSILDNRYDHPGYAAAIELGYSYARQVTTSDRRGSLLLGGAFRWDLHNGFYESWDDEHIYWLNSYTAAPRLAWHRPVGGGSSLSAELEVPLIGLVSRPPAERLTKTEPLTRFWFHLTEPQKGLRLTAAPDFLALRAGASYHTRLGKARLGLSYSFAVASYGSPARVTILSHRFGLSHRLGH